MPGMIHSKAQLRKLFALGERGELKGGTKKAEEMAHEEGHDRLSHLPEHLAEGGEACMHCGGTGYAQGGTIAGPEGLEVDDDGDEDYGNEVSEPDEDERRERFHRALMKRRAS